MQLYLILVLYFVAFSQAVLVVDPVNGSDASAGGPFKTIKGAVTYNTGSVLDLQLEPGVYNVTSALTLANTTYTLVRFTAVDPSNTIIRCTSTGYRALIFTSVNDVELYGITFTNCADTVSGTGGGVVYGTIGTIFNITNCKFLNNNGKKGGALSIATTNNPASTLIIHDSVFDSNVAASSSGGALFLSMINTDIRNTSFTNNIAASSGGAMNIYWETATGYNYNVTITDSKITGNKAFTSGGGINTYNANPMLGLTIVNSDISGNYVNTTTSCQGGGIYFYLGQFLQVVNSSISDNHAIKPSTSAINTQGGGIYTAFSFNTGFLEIDNSDVNSNSADLGGGVMITNRYGKHTPQHSIKNSFVRYNQGNINHGALVSTNCSVLIESSTFENNTVAPGGAIVVGQQGAIVELRSSIIRNNNNTGFSCQNSTTNFYQSSVYNNTIDFGCLPTCTIIGLDYNFCSESCAYRDICSACNGDLSLTCAAQCDNDTWTSRESECDYSTSTSSTSTSSSASSSTSSSTSSSSSSSAASTSTSSTTTSSVATSSSSSSAPTSGTSTIDTSSTSSSTTSQDTTTTSAVTTGVVDTNSTTTNEPDFTTGSEGDGVSSGASRLFSFGFLYICAVYLL